MKKLELIKAAFGTAGKMKKLVAVTGIITVMLIMAACGGKDKTQTQTQAQTEEDAKPIKIGDHSLLIKDVCIMENFDGTDALVITSDYTNNSKENAAFLYSIIEIGIQNGEELEPAAVITDLDTYVTSMDSQMEEIAPGETIEIQSAFVITDLTSPVEVTFVLVDDTNKNYSMTVDPSALNRVAFNGDSKTAASSEDPLLDWWNGNWYGYWIVADCTGIYEDIEGAYWDICGQIDLKDAGGTVTLWEENMHRGEPMAIVNVSLSANGTGEHGTLYSESGWFWGSTIDHADWIVDPGLIDLEESILIEGQYEGEEGGYKYACLMRPWGQIWDDVTEENLPDHYSDWYLPLLGAGKTMPDEFVVDAASSTGTESSAAAIFDTAYLGYVGGLFDEGFDEGFPKWLKENNEALLNKYPYIAKIDKEHIIGSAGHLYLIAPTDRNATISINRAEWSEEEPDCVPTEVIYRSESGEPVLLFANLSGVVYVPDTQVFITDNSGNTCEWYPVFDATNRIMPCSTEDGTRLSRDLSLYSYGWAAKYAEWLNDGWLGPTALGLAGSDTSGIIWFIDDTAWETDRKASFMLTFYPMDGTEGRVDLDWLYEGENKFEEQWSGYWSLETELDSPSLLTLNLSRVGGENFNTTDGPMYISGTYPVMISLSGEELIFTKDEEQSSLPFMAQDTQVCTLYAGIWTE